MLLHSSLCRLPALFVSLSAVLVPCDALVHRAGASLQSRHPWYRRALLASDSSSLQPADRARAPTQTQAQAQTQTQTHTHTLTRAIAALQRLVIHSALVRVFSLAYFCLPTRLIASVAGVSVPCLRARCLRKKFEVAPLAVWHTGCAGAPSTRIALPAAALPPAFSDVRAA